MPSSRTTYIGDGSTAGPYTAPPYIEQSHVMATVVGVATSFTWTNSSQITFDSAPAASAVIVIQRTTPDGTTSFSNGAALNQAALNTLRLAAQYRAEEVEDQVTDNDTDIAYALAVANSNSARITSNDTDITSLQTQVTSNDTDITSLQTQVTSNDTDVTSLQTQVTSNDTDIASLQTQVTSNDTDITALQTTTGHASSGNSALSTRLTTAEGDIDALETATQHATSGNTALNTRLVTAEGSITALLDERTAWFMDTDNTALTFDSATETLIEFERTTQGGSAAADGEFTTPFAGLWWASVTITCDPTSVTSGERWLIGIGTDTFPNAHRHMYEVDANQDHNSITFSTMVTCLSGDKIGCYLARHSGSGDYTLSTSRATNFFTGFCVKKS
jgi:predicted  nucleic acid-binding Zn-ribbon protein